MIKIWIIFNGVITLIFICLYIIGYCVIQYIYLPTYNRMLLFIPVTFYGYGGIGIRYTAGIFSDRLAVLLGRLGFDIFYLLQITARSGLLGNAIHNFILLLGTFQLFLPFVFGLFVLLNSISTIT